MKRILVGIGDEEYSSSATELAIELAQRFDATVAAIGIIDLVRIRNVGSVPVGGGEAAREMRQARYEKASETISNCIDAFVKACEDASVRFAVRREVGEAIPALIDVARYYDLLICGLGGMFEHGVVEEPRDELRQIVESGVRPLLAVAPKYRKIKRVLVAYSGSVESAMTMRQFAELNLFPRAQVKIVHFATGERDGAQILADAQAYFAAHAIETEVELVEDHARDALLPLASRFQADLIVVGNSAKSLLRRRVFGETALLAMRSSPLPLFLGQ
jgi:nucleotide-binding universal stress UspA family protein